MRQVIDTGTTNMEFFVPYDGGEHRETLRCLTGISNASSYDTTFPRPMNRVIGRTVRCSTAIYRRHHHCPLVSSHFFLQSPAFQPAGAKNSENLFCEDQPFCFYLNIDQGFNTHFPRSPSSFICFPAHSTLLFLTSRSIDPPLAICDCAVSHCPNAYRSLT
jgi:hypothetical protein